jgi:hypothetical protein
MFIRIDPEKYKPVYRDDDNGGGWMCDDKGFCTKGARRRSVYARSGAGRITSGTL